MTNVITLLRIAPAAHNDIEARIRALGPDYWSCFHEHREHGLIIVLDGSEVGLVRDDKITQLFTWPPKGITT